MIKTKKMRIIAGVLSAVMIAGAVNLYIFFLRTVKISFHGEDGSIKIEKTVRVNETVPDEAMPSTEDKIFLGWFKDADDYESYFDFSKKVKKDAELYPKFLEPSAQTLSAEEESFRSEYVEIFGTVPTVTIDTETSPNITKPFYAAGRLSIECENDAFDLKNVKMEMRLRGSNSMSYDKKSYKVKFDKKNTSVFGSSGNKNYALVANYLDRSLMRNYVSYLSASVLDGFDFSPAFRFVDLVLNGEKQGLYLLTETIEASDVRVDLDENPAAADYDTGFIIEMTSSREGKENLDYIVIDETIYEIQYPKIDDDGIDPKLYGFILDYIADYVHRVDTAVNGGDYARFLELCDEDSFADFLIVQEFSKNIDARSNGRSIYMYKKPGGKMFMGPVWDFDQTYGTYEDGGPEEYWASVKYGLYENLLKNPDFRAKYKSRYTAFFETKLRYILNAADAVVWYIYPSAKENFEIWDECLSPDAPINSKLNHLTSFGEHYGYVRYFIETRAKWMLEQLK
ncbi:MAG: CotH kinase family protein [Clostridiales bacterium]|jgi:hypothetical protein|nr:CotH kinase family protein [Clostridiales bacterium]